MFIRLCFLLLFSFTAIYSEERPRVCLNMIVKNESQVIERCLASVRPLIDTWVIVDTGSTDGTQEVIRNYLHDIPGKLYERPWVNFAHNRNEALDLAKNEAQYLLFIDADDLLVYEEGFQKPSFDKDVYHLKICYGNLTYGRPHIVKSSLNWRWIGAVHEALVSAEAFTREDLKGVHMQIVGGGDRSQDPAKFLKDALLLEISLSKDSESARDRFYLAQSYRDAGIIDLAIQNYEKRVALGGWEQEVFWSLYQIALLHERAGHKKAKIEKALLRAHNFRPTRAEPLYHLAQHYRQEENYLLAYLIAGHGMQIQEPSDILFVESWIYEYGLLFEYSIAAYWMGKYEESMQACVKLLAMDNLPEHFREAVKRNFEYAKSEKKNL